MWKEFKEFAFKGNVIDMAVGVMIGGAFGKIVTSVVNDLFMPLLNIVTGSMGDLAAHFVALDGKTYADLAAVREAGAPYIAYGPFLSTVIDFLLMALCIFLFVKLITRLRSGVSRKKAAEEPATAPRLCPYCKTEIHAEATRCPHCTSVLDEAR
ncbi:MAG: large conductance mechanosensitive channel protein MscL [Clostridiaceae bacterium]|nr:large conductance mechanosensitive channel protein MscL [Eubacteriales bacterium]